MRLELPSASAFTARRLRSLRLRLTLIYALVSALGLGALGAFVIVADGQLRSSALDDDLRLQATKGVRSVWYDENDVLQTSGVVWDDSLVAGYPQVYVMQVAGTYGDGSFRTQIAVPPRAPLYREAPLGEVASDAMGSPDEVIRRTVVDGKPVRMLSMSFDDGDGEAGGAIVAIAEETALVADKNRLVLYVALGSGGLLLLSSLAGYLLAGRSTRPALLALNQQERFLADAAHELRTPVAAIRALAEGAAAGDQPADVALARTAEIAGEASRTVDDLLTLARADADRLEVHREPLRLDLLVEEIADDVPGASVATVPVVVDGDPSLLGRAVRNLLENAVRHGRALDPNAPIEVTVEPGRVVVSDRGPGLEPGLEDRAFERFETGRRSGGSGLGLPLARLIARAHGGEITLANRHAGGAVATLVLPGARARRHAPSLKPAHRDG